MAELSIPNIKNVYQEDISIGAGTQLIYGPANIFEITVAADVAGTAVVNFSNSVTSYNGSLRCFKIVVAGPGSHTITFPKGVYLSTGLCAVSNLGSVDVQLAYE